MITPHKFGNSKKDFEMNVMKIIIELEDFYPYFYKDHVGYATIGIGTAIQFKEGKFDFETVKKKFSEAGIGHIIDRNEYEQLLKDSNGKLKGYKIEQLTNYFDKIIYDKALIQKSPAANSTNQIFIITKYQAQMLAMKELEEKKRKIRERIATNDKNKEKIKLDSTILLNLEKNFSREYASLLSLAYNTPATIGYNLIAAINSTNRARAWFEIRYKSNGGKSKNQGLANRRYIESDYFGLFDDIYFKKGEGLDPFQTRGKLKPKESYENNIGEKEAVLNFFYSKDPYGSGKTVKQVMIDYEKEFPVEKSGKKHKSIPISEIIRFLEKSKVVLKIDSEKDRKVVERYMG